MPEPTGENSTVLKLSDAFTQAHGRYLHAQIDRTFRAQILTPLQAALHKFEKQEKILYSGNISSDSKNLLLLLRSVNLLVEGLYWVGAYREAGMELQKYVKIETILRESSGKKLSDIIVDLSQLDEMKEAAPLLGKLSKSKTVFQEERRRIIREVIRVGVNIAVISDYGSHRYEEASGLLEICRGLTEGISSDDSYCYGLLGQIDYFTACSLRQINRLNDCEKKLTQVLDHYLNRINLKFNEYLAAGADEQSWFDFHRSAGLSRNRTALTLMVRSDLNRRRGKLSIALYENLAVARIILAETQDTVNRAYARMLFAIILREMYADEKNLLDALGEIEQAEKEFAEMKHRKYQARSFFERAYTLFYLARYYKNSSELNKRKSAECIMEALAILEELKQGSDPRWLAQYLTLEGRLLIIRADLKRGDGLDKRSQLKWRDDLDKGLRTIDRAISGLENKNNHKTYLVEALIAKSRVLMEKYVHSTKKGEDTGLLNKAEELLKRAQRENLNIRDGVPENNKTEAIINFALARIKIRQGDRTGAEEHLRVGVKQLPVIESEGVKRLYECANHEVSEALITFSVVNDLDMGRNKDALEEVILRHAIEKARQLGEKPWKIISRDRSTFHNLLIKHRLTWGKNSTSEQSTKHDN